MAQLGGGVVRLPALQLLPHQPLHLLPVHLVVTAQALILEGAKGTGWKCSFQTAVQEQETGKGSEGRSGFGHGKSSSGKGEKKVKLEGFEQGSSVTQPKESSKADDADVDFLAYQLRMVSRDFLVYLW